MTYTTFIANGQNLEFENILSISVDDFTKGKGFDALLSLPNVKTRTIIEVLLYIHENNLCSSADAEHFNNEYKRVEKIIESRNEK